MPRLPKQRNFYDCGLFVLQYAETFLLQPEFVLKDLHQRQGELFHRRVVDSKRDEIKRMVIAIAEKTMPIEQMGQKYWDILLKMKGTKTHYLKSPSVAAAEESKAR